MTYDRSAEENSEDKSDPRVEAVKIANRRSLDVLFNNKGVCVGFSNIFNLCGEYLGFNMERCQCLGKLEEKEYLDERTVFASNHAISKLRMFNKETQKWEEYYFDLTWDLGSKKSKYFMLTREQIMEKHQLTIQSSETQFEPPAPNLQEELEQEGVLKTATVFTKEENPGLFDVACKHLGLEPDEVDGLTQHELNSIENLYLFPINKASNGHYMLWADVRSLAGIEKFHKLSKICIQGANGDDISKFRDDNNLQVAQELQDTLSERNQISDLSPLQNCPNLKSMLILEQNKVESIDVGKLKAIPELVVFRCDNLKEVINVAEYYDSNSEDDLTVVNCGNAKMFLGKGFISQEDEQEAGRGEQSQVEEAEQITTEQTASEEAGQVATESIEAEQVESFEAEQEPMIGYEQPVEQNFVYQEQPVEVFEQDSQPLGVAQEGAQCDASLVTDYKLAEQPADYEQSAEVVDPNYAYAGYVDPNYQENEYVEPNYQDEAYAEPLYAEQNADSADYLSAEVAQPNMVDAQYADPNQVQEVLLSEGGEQMQVGDGEQSSGKASEQELSRER